MAFSLSWPRLYSFAVMSRARECRRVYTVEEFADIPAGEQDEDE